MLLAALPSVAGEFWSLAPAPRCAALTAVWSVFVPATDIVSLHYDCAADPDDLQSSAADRALLEATFGTAWLAEHVVPVIGAYGLNTNYQETACERVASAVWGDSAGFLRANKPSVASSERAVSRAMAVERAAQRWARALESGGQVYVKEGGQSDFTKEVVEALELVWPGVGRCVHIVQHSQWNEQQNHPGVTTFMHSCCNYLGSLKNHQGPIIDGNGPMSGSTIPPRRDGQWNAPFVHAANASWMGCAWRVAFHEFSQIPSWCDWRHGERYMSPIECLDFSDTHELAYILGVAPLTIEQFLLRYIRPMNQLGGNTTVDGSAAVRPTDCEARIPSFEQAMQPLLAFQPSSPPPALPPSPPAPSSPSLPPPPRSPPLPLPPQPHPIPAWLAREPPLRRSPAARTLLAVVLVALPALLALAGCSMVRRARAARDGAAAAPMAAAAARSTTVRPPTARMTPALGSLKHARRLAEQEEEEEHASHVASEEPRRFSDECPAEARDCSSEVAQLPPPTSQGRDSEATLAAAASDRARNSRPRSLSGATVLRLGPVMGPVRPPASAAQPQEAGGGPSRS